jgi:hypothetical protein
METFSTNKEYDMGGKTSPILKPQQEIYAAQLLESLSDVVDTLNEALADAYMFNFQISQASGLYVLSSLTCTKDVMPKALVGAPIDAH